jgi:hypothetical protein
MNELEKDLQKINDADQKWDFDTLDKLIKKYNNTTYEEIKEALYNLVISFRFQFMEAYESMTETEDMIDLLRSAIRCNDQLIALKPALNLELEKNQWHMMIADLVTDNSEKEKWLQKAYNTLDKQLDENEEEIDLMCEKIDLLQQLQDLKYSEKRTQDIDLLVANLIGKIQTNVFIDTVDSYDFGVLLEVIVAYFWMSKKGNANLTSSYFPLFLELIEQQISKQAELRMEYVSVLARAHNDESINELKNLEMITTNGRQILTNQNPLDGRYLNMLEHLLELHDRIINQEWKIKIGLLVEELFNRLHEKTSDISTITKKDDNNLPGVFYWMLKEISFRLKIEGIQHSRERRKKLDFLVTNFLDTIEQYSFEDYGVEYSFYDILDFLIPKFWMLTEKSAAFARSYFQLFLELAKKLFIKQPEFRMDFVYALARWHDEKNENALQNLELIETHSRHIILNDLAFGEKYDRIANELALLSGSINDRKWKMKISLLAEEFFEQMSMISPKHIKHLSVRANLYENRILDELSNSKNIDLAKKYFNSMYELINQSLAIDENWQASFYANKLKKCNRLLFGNTNEELNKKAIELYHRDISLQMTPNDLSPNEIPHINSNDMNSLAECYLLQGDTEKAWKVVQDHAAMLKEEKKEYEIIHNMIL